MGARDSLLWLEGEIVTDKEPSWYLVILDTSGSESHKLTNFKDTISEHSSIWGFGEPRVPACLAHTCDN